MPPVLKRSSTVRQCNLNRSLKWHRCFQFQCFQLRPQRIVVAVCGLLTNHVQQANADLGEAAEVHCAAVWVCQCDCACQGKVPPDYSQRSSSELQEMIAAQCRPTDRERARNTGKLVRINRENTEQSFAKILIPAKTFHIPLQPKPHWYLLVT